MNVQRARLPVCALIGLLAIGPASATDQAPNKPFEPGVDDVPITYYVCPATEWALGIVFLPRAVALYEITHEKARNSCPLRC
jgi:hypothetical protein